MELHQEYVPLTQRRSSRPVLFAALLTVSMTGLVGCMSSEKSRSSLSRSSQSFTKSIEQIPQSLGITEATNPATQVICMWQKELSKLPDPTQGGAMRQGLVGQVAFIGANNFPATIEGDLNILVIDETKRTDGSPARKPELFQYKADVLRKLRTVHEHFGEVSSVFLPWHDDWKDVNTVRILGRYQVKGKPDNDLYVLESQIVLENVKFVRTDARTGQPLASTSEGKENTQGVPDIAAWEEGSKKARERAKTKTASLHTLPVNRELPTTTFAVPTVKPTAPSAYPLPDPSAQQTQPQVVVPVSATTPLVPTAPVMPSHLPAPAPEFTPGVAAQTQPVAQPQPQPATYSVPQPQPLSSMVPQPQTEVQPQPTPAGALPPVLAPIAPAVLPPTPQPGVVPPLPSSSPLPTLAIPR